jgi:hypothetical protein
MLLEGVASAVVNVVVFAVLPLLVYAAVQRLRHGRSLTEVARRAGLTAGDARSLWGARSPSSACWRSSSSRRRST